jgi:hypothetical protein
MARDQMPWSAHAQVAQGHVRSGGTWFGLSRKELPHFRLKSQAKIHRVVRGMLHGTREPGSVRSAATPGTMHPRLSLVLRQGPPARDDYPRRRAQDSDTTQDQQGAHAESSTNTQASSLFLFDQVTSLAGKLKLNFEPA